MSGGKGGGAAYGAVASKNQKGGAGPYGKGKGKHSSTLEDKSSMVWVGNLSPHTTSLGLQLHFGQVGSVVSASVTPKRTGAVTFSSPLEAIQAVMLNLSE